METKVRREEREMDGMEEECEKRKTNETEQGKCDERERIN
jgi:hypothetical protein